MALAKNGGSSESITRAPSPSVDDHVSGEITVLSAPAMASPQPLLPALLPLTSTTSTEPPCTSGQESAHIDVQAGQAKRRRSMYPRKDAESWRAAIVNRAERGTSNASID